MKIFYMAVLCAFLWVQGTAQTINKSFTDSKGNTKLLGEVTYKRLQQKPFKEWFIPNQKGYATSEDSIQLLREALQNTEIDSITVFMGTWCGDSKREVPRFTKLLKEAKFDFSKLKIVCVDNEFGSYKQSPDGEEVGQNIHRAPTFIFHSGKEEANRIVETPVSTLPSDMLNIFQGEDYKPNYQAVAFIHQILSENAPNYLVQNQLKLFTEVYPLVSSESELNTYSYIFMSKNQLGLAEQILLLNSQLFPDKDRPLRNLGWVYSNMGAYDKALDVYKKALVINPENERVKVAVKELEEML